MILHLFLKHCTLGNICSKGMFDKWNKNAQNRLPKQEIDNILKLYYSLHLHFICVLMVGFMTFISLMSLNVKCIDYACSSKQKV